MCNLLHDALHDVDDARLGHINQSSTDTHAGIRKRLFLLMTWHQDF